jgi:hypothetical protein
MKFFVCMLWGAEALTLPQTQNQQGAKSIQKYLGDIKSPTGAVLYHVMTHFYTVQAAVELHGHSRVLFFDKNWKQLAYCEVGMPEELPERLIQNSLYFKFPGSTHQQIERLLLINSTLPKKLCLGPDANCYTV